MGVTAESLEQFIVNTQPQLEEIKASLNAFNIFNVLGVQHREIRHSNFIGWLLDPKESHHLGAIFLKSFLKLTRELNAISSDKLVSLLLSDLETTTVYRETENNIDILIVNEALDFIICIENKIHANFSKDQLNKYYTYIEQQYGYIKDRIYLTLTPFESDDHTKFKSGDQYLNIHYGQIVKLLEEHQNLINDAAPTVKASIQQYITMAKDSVINSSAESLLAQKIYKKYKKEIDFIVSSKPNLKSFKTELEGYIRKGKLEGFELSHDLGHASIIRLMPKDEELKALFHKPEFHAWGEGQPYMFCLEIFMYNNNVWMKWVFGAINNKAEIDRLQPLKTKWFDDMKAFDCFKNSKVSINLHSRNKGTADYPGICGVPLFNDDEYIEAGKEFMELFNQRFAEVNEALIQPWIAECIEKLTPLPTESLLQEQQQD